MYEKFKGCVYTFMCWRNTTDSVLSIAVWTQSGLLGKKGGKKFSIDVNMCIYVI